MGIIRMGPPQELILKLKDTCNIREFIETGTYLGNTTRWAGNVFDRVISIERSESFYRNVVEKYSHLKNIEFLHGDSREKFHKILPELKTPALFWLDAHWSGGETSGEKDECPLIEEIEIINASGKEHFIFIDDARLFTSPPSPPHLAEQWPDISTIIHMLNSARKRYIVIIEDIIISVPESARPLVVEYCQKINAAEWRNDKALIFKGLNLVFEGLKRWIR